MVFADTFYWISLVNPRDEWHDRILQATQSLGPTRLVTTDEVLIEFLNYYSPFGSDFRRGVCGFVRGLLANPNVEVLEQTRAGMASGLDLYCRRLDKRYSLTDCISMQAMLARGISEILTHDHHFAQEGFTLLLGATST